MLFRYRPVRWREPVVETGRGSGDQPDNAGWMGNARRQTIDSHPGSDAAKAYFVRGYLQADETTVLVQVNDKSGKHHEGYLWQFGRPGGGVAFEFALVVAPE